MTILTSSFFNFSKKKIGFYKLSFRFFYFNSISRIPTLISHIPTQIPRISHPDFGHSHPYSLHSHPHSPHSPHSVPRFPIQAFTDSHFVEVESISKVLNELDIDELEYERALGISDYNSF